MPRKKTTRKPSPKATEANRGRSVSGKCTPEVLASVCQLHAGGMPLGQACMQLAISLTGFYEYMQRHPDFKADVFQAARDQFIVKLEEKAFEAAMDSDPKRFPTMLIFMLKAHKPDVYGDRSRVQVTPGNDFASAFFTAMQGAANGKPTAAH